MIPDGVRKAGVNYQKNYFQPMISPSRSSLLETLVERLAGLPSIGRKSAQRLAYHILGSSMEEVEALSRALVEARRGVKPCSECGNHAEADLCAVCSSPRRDKAVVCVVEVHLGLMEYELLVADFNRHRQKVFDRLHQEAIARFSYYYCWVGYIRFGVQ